jgi:hypothetical protein
LLHVPSLSLKRGVSRITVDKHFTSHNSHGDTGGKDIQKRSLTGTRYTLSILVVIKTL